jgi:2-polyprenyl-3-methyl-5-hydroxy-6-metoxy-1,4-benzoquinol methylase
MTQRSINYDTIAAFWRRSTEGQGKKLDYIAGQDKLIPLAAQARLRDAQMDFFRAHVQPTLGAASRVLDLGCGPGVWALDLAPRVGEIIGVDIAPAFIEYARGESERRSVSNAHFEVASFLDYQPPHDGFDLIVLGAMLVHVDDPELSPLLQRVRGWLRPGGAVYVRTSLAPRARYARRGGYQALYRTLGEYQEAFLAAGFSFVQERDTAYTDASLAAAYFGLGNALSLGLLRRSEALGLRLFEVLQRRRALVFEAARALSDCTPLPLSYHFLLRPLAE